MMVYSTTLSQIQPILLIIFSSLVLLEKGHPPPHRYKPRPESYHQLPFKRQTLIAKPYLWASQANVSPINYVVE